MALRPTLKHAHTVAPRIRTSDRRVGRTAPSPRSSADSRGLANRLASQEREGSSGRGADEHAGLQIAHPEDARRDRCRRSGSQYSTQSAPASAPSRRMRPAGPVSRDAPPRDLIALEVLALRRWPTSVKRLHGDRPAREDEAMPADHEGLDPRRREFEFGLAADGIDRRIHERADAGIGGVGCRSNESGRKSSRARSRRWCAGAPPCGPSAWRPAPARRRRRPKLSASAGCMSTKGSGRCAASRGERPVRVMRMPLIADAAGVEHQRVFLIGRMARRAADASR